MNETIIEQVAIAIWQADDDRARISWEECVETFKDKKRKQAKAAIEALHLPYHSRI